MNLLLLLAGWEGWPHARVGEATEGRCRRRQHAGAAQHAPADAQHQLVRQPHGAAAQLRCDGALTARSTAQAGIGSSYQSVGNWSISLHNCRYTARAAAVVARSGCSELRAWRPNSYA